jgi:hypothetical protein
MVKHMHTFEKQKINLFNNIFQDICIYSDYCRIKIVNCTYQKSSTSEPASVIRALSCSCLSCFSLSRFDLEGVSLKDLVLLLTLHHMWLILLESRPVRYSET